MESSEVPEFCRKARSCGHECLRVSGEQDCHLQCFNCAQIIEESKESAYSPASLCSICYTSSLEEEPSVRLRCSHEFHAPCLTKLLQAGCPTLNLTFGFLDCPSCKQEILLDYDVPDLSQLLFQKQGLKGQVRQLALKVMKEQGLDKTGRVSVEGDLYFNQPEKFAVEQCTIFDCFSCKKLFFGGLKDCEVAMNAEATTAKEDLLCRRCMASALGVGKADCSRHGDGYIDYKCTYCCAIATFSCSRGQAYFCEPCHNDHMVGKRKPKTACTGGLSCPLRLDSHPAAVAKTTKAQKGVVYPLGCSICRSQRQSALKVTGQTSQVKVEERKAMVSRFSNLRPKTRAKTVKVAVARRMPATEATHKVEKTPLTLEQRRANFQAMKDKQQAAIRKTRKKPSKL